MLLFWKRKLKNIKIRKTNKLHYGKYLYKLKFQNDLASIFRTEFQRKGSLSYARMNLEIVKNSKHTSGSYLLEKRFGKSFITESCLQDAEFLYGILIKNDDYTIRCEYKGLTLYSNDLALLENIADNITFYPRHIELWKPEDSDINLLLSNKNIIIIDKPTDYPYKVTFGNKLGNVEFGKWIDLNPDKIKAGDIFKQTCLHGGWIKGSYVYVRDEKVLFLIKMFVGDNISKIDKLIYKEDIDK